MPQGALGWAASVYTLVINISAYVGRIVKSCCFYDHIDDSRETAPGCNVQGCFAALFTLLDVGAGGK